MSSGMSYSMPILVVNLSCEMINIIEQRFIAQNINQLKRIPIFANLISMLFKPSILEDLFKPQYIHMDRQIKNFFETIINSSNIHINQYSMDKLYELMCMGCKCHILNCSHPRYFVDITIDKINLSLGKIETDSTSVSTLDSLREMITKLYMDFTDYDFYIIKQCLLRFFQGKRLRVSVFIHDQIQCSDGSLLLDISGSLPDGVEPAGKIRYYNGHEILRTGLVSIIYRFPIEEYPGYYKSNLNYNLYINNNLMSTSPPLSIPSSPTHQNHPIYSNSQHHFHDVNTNRNINSTADQERSLLSDLIGIDMSIDKIDKLNMHFFNHETNDGKTIDGNTINYRHNSRYSYEEYKHKNPDIIHENSEIVRGRPTKPPPTDTKYEFNTIGLDSVEVVADDGDDLDDLLSLMDRHK